jgi:hypothetical protein
MSVVWLAIAIADEKPKAPELPDSIESLLRKAESDIEKEKQKFFVATRKVTSKLSADLQKEVEKATKAGNLKLALAIEKKIEQISAGEFVKGLLNGQSDLRKPAFLDGSGLIGRWTYAHGTIAINGNGFAEHSAGHRTKVELAPQEKRAILRWTNGVVDWIELVPGERATAQGGNTEGTTWEWKRER